MVEFGTSSAFRGWVRVRVLGYGFGVRGIKVKSRDCALASDLVNSKSRYLISSLSMLTPHSTVYFICRELWNAISHFPSHAFSLI